MDSVVEPSFDLVEWSFSDRKWVSRGRYVSKVEAFDATKIMAGGYYRIDDTNYARGEVFYTGKSPSLYSRAPFTVK
jgi:hypothetical protein